MVNLDCNTNNLQSLNVSGLILMHKLTANNNQLTTINLAGLTSLYDAQFLFNNLSDVILQNNIALEILNLNGLVAHTNNFSVIDIRQNPFLSSIGCNFNPNLHTLYLKNGINNQIPNSSYFYNCPNLAYICTDDSEISGTIDFVTSQGYTSTVNSYCSFTPGGTFYTVQGNTKFDSNNNGCDANDLNKSYQKFNITSGSNSGSVIANNSGNYSIPIQSGSHTITPILENPSYFNISPTSFTANFPAQTSPLTQNFCLTANGTHNDLEVVILPITAASPGFDAKYKIVYKNKGTTTQSGTLVFNYDDNLMNFLNATLSPNSQTTGVLNWNFTNLLPFEAREITVILKLNTPTQTPALNGGDILHYTAQINGTTDETPSDNILTLNQTVVNSFDPNDKTCLEGTAITQAKVGDYVHYLIRFENTGTANAQNIVVKDEIDISKYDVSSLIALNASHNFATRITGNVVEFIFENIQLPFNNATNDGYVSFKIKTRSNLTLGDSFSNSAKIYFDYNHPIITNTYTTTVQNVLGTSEISNDKPELSIYPNPVKDVLNIQSKNQIVKAEIYDVNGRILISTSLKGNSIHVSELSKGHYIIKLFSKDKTTVHKFIKN
ncbi:T9SS type A sorting domain-containing protein [Chryseobacterium sp. NKUCC03_KSP]|uniref:T9SS type A sorting domain-containing protein n=1 Tax=Chryseobacterium sp. NKUCC03_KSP TaxID=2842125 RepID=UPI001C5B5AAB|nr:T9SS type A sorting domain-containing protein [Chryseobacterium sp. NKUCC03_KSP]MBW3523789.1 T9SS type A sorting domain-containing protein [Chryseobacterium sp. NKUCC03_KSP]